MPAHVLLLDADSALTTALAEALRRGFGSSGGANEIVVCSSPEDAFGRAFPDVQVVVAEVLWPGHRPGEIVRGLGKQFPGVSVVALTASTAADSIIEVTRAGAFDCLLKPADPARVREVVAKAVRHHTLIAPANASTVSPIDSPSATASLSSPPLAGEEWATPTPRSLEQAMEGPEREIILAALVRNAFNRNATAAELQIKRTTLYKKMRKHRLDVGELNAPPE